MRTLKKLSLAVSLSTAALVAAPASATIIVVDASSIQGANVLFNAGTQTGAMVSGFTQGGTQVNFTGTTAVGNVISANGGQARVEGSLNGATQAPNDTLALTSLNFALASGTFNNLEFNLFGAANGDSASFAITDNEGQVFNFTRALGTGENFFGFQGILGESIANVAITTTAGIQDIRQIRLDETPRVGAVPEPGTWAMMLIGFGAVGVGMRRRRRTEGGLLQVA
jgi:hypothetical protein